MKALKYLNELIEFEKSYQLGYTSENEEIPKESINRLQDLKEARNEVFALSNVVSTEWKCCDWFLPDSMTSSATKCQKCGKEKWEHKQH